MVEKSAWATAYTPAHTWYLLCDVEGMRESWDGVGWLGGWLGREGVGFRAKKDHHFANGAPPDFLDDASSHL